MLQLIRAFFLLRDVLEVETPALSRAGNTDPNIESLQIHSDTKNYYLHTSPEYPMKRLLADNSGDIYQICKVWRQGESGNKHNPEFTMLEWYRNGFDYVQLMQEVNDLLVSLIPNLQSQATIVTYSEVFLENFGFNPHIVEIDPLKDCIKQHIQGLETDNLSEQAMLDALFSHCIEPTFSQDRLTFVKDYPASQSALAKLREEKDFSVAQRFEVFLGEMELGNGYQEETDYQRNQAILAKENKQREDNGLETVQQDNYFLQATKSGLPESAGVAIGLDRVLMCICGEKSIQKVINFPWDKA